MAAKKKAKKQKPRRVRRVHPRYRRYRGMAYRTPAARKFSTWSHDVDTLLHELVRNPALIAESPATIVKRAEDFADALHAMQDRRRPLGVPEDVF